LIISGPVAAWQDEAGFGLGQLAGLTSGTLAAAAGAYSLSGVADGDADAVRGAVADRDGWQAFVSAPGVTADLSNEVARLTGEVAERDTMIGDLNTQITDRNNRRQRCRSRDTDSQSQLSRGRACEPSGCFGQHGRTSDCAERNGGRPDRRSCRA